MIGRAAFQLGAATLFVACVAPSSGTAIHEGAHELTGRFDLRVSLYPWIPDPQSFADWIESDFESRNPDINLVVRPMAKSYSLDLAYETDLAVAALTDASSPDHQDLIEIDTLTLGVLGAQGAIAPFD